MRIVLDTNILVSALISGEGPPGQVLAAVKSPGITLITSRFQIDELRDVLARDRLQPYIRRDEAGDLVYHLEAVAVVVGELPEVSLSADPDDNPILATAIDGDGDADLIVSGDRGDMLAVGSAHGIPIVTAREAAGRLRACKRRLIALDTPDVQRVSAPNFQMLLAVSANSQRLSSSLRNAMCSRNSSRPRP